MTYKKLTSKIRLLRNIIGIKYGSPRPILAVWDTTYRCNMRCWFCNEKNLITEEMTTKQVLEMIQQLDRLNTSVILLTGGEPTLREDINIIMDAIRRSGMLSIFTTNGFITKSKLETLLKADMIRLSVDAYGEVHDKIRGTPGAFEKIREAVSLLVKAKKPPMIACVVTPGLDRQNLRQLFDFARQWRVLIDLSLVTYSMRTNIISENENKTSQIQKEARIDGEDFLRIVDEFQKEYPDVVANPTFHKKLIRSGGLGKRCRALDVTLSIRPDGKVSIPCDAFTLLELDGSLIGVWQKMQKLYDIKKKLGEYNFCNDCYKKCIAYPSFMLNFRNLMDLAGSYFPIDKGMRLFKKN